jgi:small-conductance mechanosensitive channel
MDTPFGWLGKLVPIVPSAVAAAAVLAVLFVAHYVLQRRRSMGHGRQLEHQLVMVALTFVGVIAIVLVLPLRDATKGQLLTLIGLLVTAAIALSSTTFVGNAMAGVMLRAVRNFHTGDFVRVGEHFGRVSERGLFHTELQTEDRDLTTLPNLYLVSNPVTVMRSSGTVLSARVSLGYDVPRSTVKRLLLEAGNEAGLVDPFVQVQKLGDFSVTYRLAGLLTEVKQVLSARSRLRGLMMDHLHQGGVEIVSPTFMNTRAFEKVASFIPHVPEPGRAAVVEQETSSAETLAFDKAERAESLESLRRTCEELAGEIKSLKERIKEAEVGAPRESLERELKRLEARRERLSRVIEQRETTEPE